MGELAREPALVEEPQEVVHEPRPRRAGQVLQPQLGRPGVAPERLARGDRHGAHGLQRGAGRPAGATSAATVSTINDSSSSLFARWL